jgi:hypothetical protein
VKVHIDRELERFELVRRRSRQGAAGIEDHDHLIAVGKRKKIGDAGFQHFQIDRIGVIRALQRRRKKNQRKAKEEHARFFRE